MPDSFSDVHFEQFDTTGPAGTALGAEWEVYNADPGNGGFGVRASSQVEVVTEATSVSGGNVLRLTAEDVGGEHYHGGVKLLIPQTYGQAEIRVRVADDASEVTSGVVLFWPTANATLFPPATNPEGVWPSGGELDFWESFDDRDTRTPVRSFIHRLNPAATAPYTASDDEVVVNYQHYVTDGVPGSGGIDQSDWHKIVCTWTPSELSIEIDNGAKRILTTDPASIPDWDMELCLQLDAWSDTPPASPVTMDIDYVVLREWVPGTSSLPEGDLTTDHIAHHEELHDLVNILAVDTDQTGRVLMVESIGTPNAVGERAPVELMSGHILTVSHSVAGALTIPLTREVRAVVVNASANITSAVITGTASLGDWFELPVLLKASGSISVDLTGIETVGPAVPGSMTAAQVYPFRAMVWP